MSITYEKITEKELLSDLSDVMSATVIIIADGHVRRAAIDTIVPDSILIDEDGKFYVEVDDE